ncbi:cellulase family glycosylhydrolase [Herbaspirillum sp. RTI4]|uniref:cellulase family glycosylhydrolase n=1 Tax=Herbaspirillum sp. RTI4 TaxID=3048640 RepID=UPI002AB3A6EA|nr:cellulase family glycosylhydrolase [Herbaspirillum sp. RTI4]MDY7578262.1 cellulase family glycosylhydrolase [Herbaspirillum sp. RTI4]MEA9981245.1 cellulase family glycosylhydrolase [Herbaspirillum sp. RTI4]
MGTGICLALAASISQGAENRTAPAAFTTAFTTAGGMQFYPFAIDQDGLRGAPDRSALNRELDAAARIFVRDGHFYRVGPDLRANSSDDARVRLYGINLSFATNFPTPENAVRLARRLRKLGFNAVRLHHMDTLPGTMDNPKSLLTPGAYPSFNPVAQTRLKNFIAALKQEGLYVNLNLHVGYRFRAALDHVPTAEGNADRAALGAPVYVYTPRMIALQEEYARQLLRALNLRNDPVLAMVEINNESSLLAAWQRREWKQAVPKAYEAELQRQWQRWVSTRYGNVAAACKAWKTCDVASVSVPLLTPADADYLATDQLGQWGVRLDGKLRALSDQLFGASDPGEPGNSGNALRIRDFLQFLVATDSAYFNRLRDVVHQETDPLVPVTGTQMGYGGVLNFDSQAKMDYIDEHFYVDHPDFPGVDRDRHDWRMHDSSLSGGEFNRLLALSMHKDSRKPYVISEYNQPFPNRQAPEMLPLMAAVAAQQDWDGLFLFDYMDGDTWSTTPNFFTLSGNWNKFALTGQSAQLYRQSEIAPLRDALAIPLPPVARYAIAASLDRSAQDTHLALRYGVTPETALQARLSMDLNGKPEQFPRQTATAAAATETTTTGTPLRSANGELEYQSQQRVVLLRSPRSVGFFGFFDRNKRSGDERAWLKIQGKGRAYTSLLASSLDGKPLATSKHVLIAVAAAVTSTQPGSIPPRPKELARYKSDAKWLTLESDGDAASSPSGAAEAGSGPVWMERTELNFGMRTAFTALRVYPLDGNGQRRAPLPASRIILKNGEVILHLQADVAETSPWYEVVEENKEISQ